MRPFEQVAFSTEMGEIWHLKLGDAAQGAILFERALENDPDQPRDLREKALQLASRILEFDPDVRGGQGYTLARDILESGRALEKMRAIIAAQGERVEQSLGRVLVSTVATTFEDLEQRERALEWVERAFAVGVSPGEFEDNPTLRELVADERYLGMKGARRSEEN